MALLVLAEMREHAILPTPRNYDLWFTFRTDMNPALTQRVRLALDEGQALTPAVLDTLHGECVAGVEVNVDAISGHSDAIQEATQTLIDQGSRHRTGRIARFGARSGNTASVLSLDPVNAKSNR
ncbi:MAG: hypothetical protein ACRYHQ_39630 [Janthinobacterium lividum]